MTQVLVAILGLAALMVVHEAGHYFAARRYGMRVLRFSIGFGPTLWKHQPKDSPTVFQVALIPFLAYVQIAGMNPFEEPEDDDAGSYAKASLWARIVTIAAGPIANYLFASIFFFVGMSIVGHREVADTTSMVIQVAPDGPAAKADIRTGDRILKIDETPIGSWPELIAAIKSKPGQPIEVAVERAGETVVRSVTPLAEGENKGKILIGASVRLEKLSTKETLTLSVVQPALIVYETVRRIGRMVTLKDKVSMNDFGGPVAIVQQVKKEAERGPGWYLNILGGLSAYLAAFNLLPFPALDGGRLMFLGWEAAARRRPDPKTEAKVHALGLLMLLGLIAVVTVFDVMRK